jgi:hypothetical protein
VLPFNYHAEAAAGRRGEVGYHHTSLLLTERGRWSSASGKRRARPVVQLGL